MSLVNKRMLIGASTIAAMLGVGLVSVPAFAANPVCAPVGGGWDTCDFIYVNLPDGTKAINGISEAGAKKADKNTTLYFPSMIDGKKITQITQLDSKGKRDANAMHWFKWNMGKKLKYLPIKNIKQWPIYMTKIDAPLDGEFLTSINKLPETLTEIGDEVFQKSALGTLPPWPQGLKVIGKSAFANINTHLVLPAKWPDHLEKIKLGAFAYAGLTKLPTVWPNSLKEIGMPDPSDKYEQIGCFNGNDIDGIVGFAIPASTKIGPFAFADNSFGLVIVPNSIKNIPSGMFAFNTTNAVVGKSVTWKKDNSLDAKDMNSVYYSPFSVGLSDDGSVGDSIVIRLGDQTVPDGSLTYRPSESQVVPHYELKRGISTEVDYVYKGQTVKSEIWWQEKGNSNKYIPLTAPKCEDYVKCTYTIKGDPNSHSYLTDGSTHVIQLDRSGDTYTPAKDTTLDPGNGSTDGKIITPTTPKPTPGTGTTPSPKPTPGTGTTPSKPGTTPSKPGTTPSKTGNVTPGKTDSKTGKPDVKPGKTDSKPGKTDVKPGKIDPKTGKPNVKPGKTDSKPGKTDVKKIGNDLPNTGSNGLVTLFLSMLTVIGGSIITLVSRKGVK